MRIRSVRVERYAGLGGVSLSDLSPGLNILVGCNEAGKTSMMEFLRTTLAPSNSRRYPHLDGTVAGSMVLVTMGEDECTARRTGRSKVTYDSPNPLFPVDAEVYDTVFALGLEDLEAMDLQDPAGVASRLMATSLGIPRLPEAMDALKVEMDSIYTIRGRKQEIPMALAELKAVDAEMALEQTRLPDYLSLVDEIRSLVEDQELLEMERVQCRAELDRVEVCIREAEGLLRRRELQAMVRRLRPSSSLEPGTYRRHNDLEDDIEGRRAGRESLQNEEASLLEKMGDDLPPTDHQLEEWLSRLGQLRKVSECLPNIEAEAMAIAREMDRRLSELGMDWTVDRMRIVDISIPSLDSIRTIATRYRDARSSLSRALAQYRGLDQEMPLTFSEVGGRTETLARLHGLLLRKEGRDPSWRVAAPVMAMTLLGATVLSMMQSWLPAIAIMLSGVCASTAVYWARESRAREQDGTVAALLHELGLRQNMGVDEVERLRGDAYIEEALTGGSAPAQRLRERQRVQRMSGLDREIASLKVEMSETEAAWASALKRSGLPLVEPDGLEHVISLMVECRDIEDRQGHVLRSLHSSRSLLESLSEAMDHHNINGETPLETLQRLDRENEFKREIRAKDERLRGRLEVTQATLASTISDLDRMNTELDMMRSGMDRETFIGLALDRDDLISAERELRDIETGLRARLPPYMDLEDVEAIVIGSGGSGLQDSRDTLLKRMEGIEVDLSNDRRTMGVLAERQRNMGASIQLDDITQRRAVLIEGLREMADRWAVSALTAALLETVRSMYEGDRQPTLMTAASKSLGHMTGSRHRLVLSASGGLVVDDGVERKGPELWSRGLRDQAYLSLRLALIAEHGAVHEPLPVILDDVMARSDPERQRGIARCIVDMAEHNQVLMFTCHPETASMMVKECPRMAVFHYAEGIWDKVDGW